MKEKKLSLKWMRNEKWGFQSIMKEFFFIIIEREFFPHVSSIQFDDDNEKNW